MCDSEENSDGFLEVYQLGVKVEFRFIIFF